VSQVNAASPAKNTADRFKQVFQEEAREVLVELESTLLELNENQGDGELVGKAFRALHTIKGSGSMFGFDRLAAFTHNLENAFDEIRTGRLAVTSKIIDLSLSALDQMKVMLEDAAGEGATEDATSSDILERLQILTGLPKAGPVPTSQPALSTSANSEGVTHKWHIQFRPGPDLMRQGSDPRLLFRDLRQLGSLQVQADMGAVPLMGELDPERCYVSWDMVLTTSATSESIRDVFIFVEDCCELTIEQIPDEAEDTVDAVPQELGEEPSRFGRRRDDREASIRVPAAKLDQLINLVGELVTVQARMNEIAANSDNPEVAAISEEIDRLTSALRENSMSIRMLPIRATFERFRRLVHDLARELHKTVELTIEGADTELDKTVIDQLNDPLMHLIRNSMDHGIESPEARLAAGKPAVANIHLSARHAGANVLIRITDDGGGIASEAVRKRAVQRGMISADSQLTEAEVFALILEPGFSTALQVTDVSGRGVGMDVVRQRVEALRGRIDIASKTGEGTSVTLCLPLTMAIIDGLLVRVGHAYFVLPLANTLECIELTRQDIEKANGKHLANVRDEIIPYICLREQFNIQGERPEREQIMVAETEQGRYGFVVDQVIGDHQTVIKSLGRFYRHVQIISGATILGNGSVALILDPHRLAQDAIRSASLSARGHPPHGTSRPASSYPKDVPGLETPTMRVALE
jgi:two-component system chemotaxis sensor kinase CheA